MGLCQHYRNTLHFVLNCYSHEKIVIFLTEMLQVALDVLKLASVTIVLANAMQK